MRFRRNGHWQNKVVAANALTLAMSWWLTRTLERRIVFSSVGPRSAWLDSDRSGHIWLMHWDAGSGLRPSG